MNTTPRKKLLIVITKSNWGGAQRYVFDLALRMKNYYEVLVALGGEGELKKRLEEAQIPVTKIDGLQRDVKAANEYKAFFKLLKITRTFRPDIMHTNSSKIGAMGAAAGKMVNAESAFYDFFSKLFKKKSENFRRRTKVVFTAHGWAFNENRSIIQKSLIRFIHWLTLIFSDRTIAVSHAMVKDVEKMPFVLSKISVIHNGIQRKIICSKKIAQDHLFHKSEKLREALADPKKAKSTLWIGTVSELHRNKGLSFIIESLSQLKESYASFVFVVLGEGEERKNLEEMIEKKGLLGHVFLIGNIEGAYMYMNAFHIFTLTSVTEGLPYALLEAGNAKLPVIGSNVGGIPEIIEQMHTGILIRPENSKDIKEAIEFLLEHREKRKLFAENHYKKIQTEFSLEKMIEETKKVYEENVNS